jgi:hypothetical protein
MDTHKRRGKEKRQEGKMSGREAVERSFPSHHFYPGEQGIVFI